MQKIYVLILSLVVSVTMSAQRLTGSVDAYGSWNFDKGHKENAALKLNFDSTLYYVHVGVSGGHNFSPTTEVKGVQNENIKKKMMSLKTDTNQIKTRTWDISAFLDFGYHITNNDLISLSAEYTYEREREEDAQSSIRYLLETNPDLILRMDTLFGYQNNLSLSQEHNIRADLGYEHQFSSHNSLSVFLRTDQFLGGDGKQCIVQGDMFADAHNYTDFDVLGERKYQVSLVYDDRQLAGIENLKMKAGIDLLFDNDDDHYRADYNLSANRDSTILNFYRSYLSQFTEPFIHLQYKHDGWLFSIQERPQIYSNLQWDMLTGSPLLLNRHTQCDNLAEAKIGYLFKTRHRFDLSYNHNVKHPNYKQFSSMMRLSDSEGEFIQGNDSIRPERSHKLNFRYTYKKDEHLLTTLDVFYRNLIDKIEKVVIVNETNNKEIETLKTFTNSKLQHSVGGTLRLKLDYEFLDAEAWSSVQWERFMYYSGAKPKDEVNYQLGLMLSAHLNQWVDLTSSLVYVSPTRSAFTEKNEYIGADLRLTYKSPVGVQLFVEANDIINKPRTETTWNKSMTYMKVKEVYQNRSCLGIGIRYDW